MKTKTASKKDLTIDFKSKIVHKVKPSGNNNPLVHEVTFRNLIDLFPLLTELAHQVWSPWAVLLVRFRDNQQPLPLRTKYRDLFTSAGSGTLNMVDFFNDM